MAEAQIARMGVLVGGLDSCVLTAEMTRTCALVIPLYIRAGLVWEECELRAVRRFLSALDSPALAPLQVLHLPLDDLYGRHWALTGRGVPEAGSPAQAVEMIGRNLMLLAKALVFAALHSLDALALAILRGNPFPDAQPKFLQNLSALTEAAVGRRVQILTPFAALTKAEVVARGRTLPLELTWSCLTPDNGLQCGRCNKCHERQCGFRMAGAVDHTAYAHPLDDALGRGSAACR